MLGFVRRLWLGLAMLCALLSACGAGLAETANPRLALVIGAAAYPDARLATPVNDASLIAEVLKSAGFDVTGAADPDQSRFRELLRDFLRKAHAAGPDLQAFVYFAGRAIQYEGQNYLVPIDARIDRAGDTPLEAVSLDDLTHALADAPGLARIVVVDGARPNPYAKEGRPLAGGLALAAPPPGTLIGFDAAPGARGAEASGAYGVYAKALADQLRQGGVPIADAFSRTRLAVNQATDGAVAPWSVSKLAEPYYLLARAAEAAPESDALPILATPLKQLSPAQAYDAVVLRDTQPAYEEFLADFPNAPQAERVRAMLAARREAMIWRLTRERDTADAYWTYLKDYPKGPHVGDAERALEALGASTTPPDNFRLVDYGDLGAPTAVESSFVQGSSYYFGAGLGPPPAPAVSVSSPDENLDWQSLPAPPTTFTEALPVLPFAIPLLPHARRFHHPRPTGDGREGEGGPEPPPGRQVGPVGRAPEGTTASVPPHASLPSMAAPLGRPSPLRPRLYAAPRYYAPPRLAPAIRSSPFVSPSRLGGPSLHLAPAPHFAPPRLATPGPALRR